MGILLYILNLLLNVRFKPAIFLVVGQVVAARELFLCNSATVQLF